MFAAQEAAMMGMANAGSGYNPEYFFGALLGLAETFRTANPPRIRNCIQCLQAMFNFNLPVHLQMLAHFNLGKVLHYYTRNADLARINLERAYTIAQQMQQMNQIGLEEYRVQTASILAEIYLDQKHIESCKNILKSELDISRGFSFWHCRFLFQLAEVYQLEHELKATYQLLDVGAEFCMANNVAYTEALFRLSKGMLLMIDRNRANEVRPILERVGQLITNIGGVPSRRESIKSFFLILQLCYFLQTGAIKTAKPCLKQLQTSVQVLTSSPEPDQSANISLVPLEHFHWLPKEQITILVYLLTVMHSMQAGQTERVSKYTEKALSQIDKLKTYSRCSGQQMHLLTTFQLLLLEHSCMTRLVVGQPSLAIQEISLMCQLVSQCPGMFGTYEAQLHTLLGLYAMQMKCSDTAEKQFSTALRTARDMDLWSFVNLNLAILYLYAGRDQDFYGILERITPERIPSSSQSLLAASHYVRGLQSFFQSRFQEAKRYLKDSLAISNKEDVMRISAAALVLLGNIFLRYQSLQECSNMLSPAMELVNKIPDLNLQIWATSLLKDVYLACGDQGKAAESRQVYESYLDRLQRDRQRAQTLNEHKLMQWSEGPYLSVQAPPPAETSVLHQIQPSTHS